MFKRLIACLMVALLVTVGISALADADGITVDGAPAQDAIDEIIDIGVPELSIEDLGSIVLPNEGEEDDTLLPTELSVKKSATKKVLLGVDYQITIPGKKIKSCKSSNKKIATVTKQGLIHTKKAGEVKITVTPKKGSKLKLKLKVIDPTVPTAVAINEGASATMLPGETMLLTATVTPDTASQAVAWSSSDDLVASVDAEGLVTALAPGSTTIYAVTGNGLKATLALKVLRSATGHYMISHAMGGIDGYSYSNCLEGFLENYEEGHRIFEVDMEYTSDGKLVLWHDWNRQFSSKYKKGRTPTHSQFMKSRIYDRYTPMDLEALLRLMDQYPDVRIVTDTKHSSSTIVKKQFKTIVSTAKQLGIPGVLDRFIVEIYNKDMFRTIEKIHHFREYMVTLYKAYKKAPTKSQLQDVARFCKNNGIATVAMYAKWWNPKYAGYIKPYGLDIALYTVNTDYEAQNYFDDGVTALFTDFLPPVQ